MDENHEFEQQGPEPLLLPVLLLNVSLESGDLVSAGVAVSFEHRHGLFLLFELIEPILELRYSLE